MSEDWFDKTYRSDETSPADLDARVLRRARRATRRWAVALVAGAVLTLAIALILAIVITRIELDVPPTERSASDAEARPAAAGECVRTLSLMGPLGGPGRQDRAEVCLTTSLLRAEISWDGAPLCPSRFAVEASPDTPIRLEAGALVIGSARYGCVDGEWRRE